MNRDLEPGKFRAVNVSQRRNLERLLNLASLAMNNLLPVDRVAPQAFVEEFARLAHEEGLVLTRQVKP